MSTIPNLLNILAAKKILALSKGRNVLMEGPYFSLFIIWERKTIYIRFCRGYVSLTERDDNVERAAAAFKLLGWKVVDVLLSN